MAYENSVEIAYLDNRLLGLSYVEQVAAQKVGKSGTYIIFVRLFGLL